MRVCATLPEREKMQSGLTLGSQGNFKPKLTFFTPISAIFALDWNIMLLYLENFQFYNDSSSMVHAYFPQGFFLFFFCTHHLHHNLLLARDRENAKVYGKQCGSTYRLIAFLALNTHFLRTHRSYNFKGEH